MQTKRRSFLLGLAAGGAALGTGWTLGERIQAEESAVLDASRRQAARRRRRIIFNNDGDDIWTRGADPIEEFLAVRHTPLLQTHVDSIFYCTTQSFNHFTHATRIGEVFTSKEGQFSANNLAGFLQQQSDGMRMSSRFAHDHGIESFWTLRMNDVHDAWTPAFVPEWKREDPTRVMSSQSESGDFNDRRRLWSLVDFEHPDVVPRLLAVIEEVLTRYDIDGIELDFLRAPCYFRATYEGRPATAVQIGIMTSLVKKIRALVLRESERQAKPFLLAARLPVTIALSRKIGLDVNAWLEEKLIDMMALGGGYVTFDAPLKELIDLGHKHGVSVYPCLSQSGLLYRPPRGNNGKQPAEAWFGAASRCWHDGADGIYTFNLFPDPGDDADRDFARKVFSTIGSPEMLADARIMYAKSDAGWWMPSHYWAKDAADISHALPLDLKPNEFVRTYLTVPEDLRGAGFDVSAELRVDFTGLSKDNAPQILFGSANFGPTSSSTKVAGVRRYVCNVPLQAMTQGPNRLMVKTKASGAKLAGAELWIQR